MELLMWFLIAVWIAGGLYLLLSIIWAAVMVYRVMRGMYGDLTDLGGDDGTVRPEP